jgi:hypothetical protein
MDRVVQIFLMDEAEFYVCGSYDDTMKEIEENPNGFAYFRICGADGTPWHKDAISISTNHIQAVYNHDLR